jgi:2-oxoglutarate/2-oxoacid ferredoxin oxidoreductase subunit beta
MVTVADYKSIDTAWCPGCGNFGILTAVKQALVKLGKRPEEVLLVSGIGQAAKLPHYLRCNVFNGLHGRALPAAQAAKIANKNLLVLAVGGDGDMYGEGGNHLLHAIRRNIDMTLLVHNNKVYGLTKGQASPTTDLGVKTKVQTGGVISEPLNPLALAISQHCSFVARAFSGALDHLADIIRQGIENPGFSLIDILQPCVSFNHVNTHAFYKQRVYDLNKENTQYNIEDQSAALAMTHEWGDRIPTGVFYRAMRNTYESQTPVLQGKPLVDQELSGNALKEIMKKYY